jgi:hypothetical protein
MAAISQRADVLTANIFTLAAVVVDAESEPPSIVILSSMKKKGC